MNIDTYGLYPTRHWCTRSVTDFPQCHPGSESARVRQSKPGPTRSQAGPDSEPTQSLVGGMSVHWSVPLYPPRYVHPPLPPCTHPPAHHLLRRYCICHTCLPKGWDRAWLRRCMSMAGSPLAGLPGRCIHVRYPCPDHIYILNSGLI